VERRRRKGGRYIDGEDRGERWRGRGGEGELERVWSVRVNFAGSAL
jgi:hypothetical protein